MLQKRFKRRALVLNRQTIGDRPARNETKKQSQRSASSGTSRNSASATLDAAAQSGPEQSHARLVCWYERLGAAAPVALQRFRCLVPKPTGISWLCGLEAMTYRRGPRFSPGCYLRIRRDSGCFSGLVNGGAAAAGKTRENEDKRICET